MDAFHTIARRATSCSSGSSSTSTSEASTSNSISTFVSTLVPVGLFALVYLALFLILRTKFPRQYQPRTFLGRESERSPKLSSSKFGWFKEFWNISDTYVLTHHSIDAYLFLRFLKIAVVSCLVGCLITWPILFPINATGGAGKTQFDAITIANISGNYYKTFAHALCAIVYFSYIIYTITRESIFYINLRQAYLLSPLYASRLSSRTVLFTSVPKKYMEEANLRAMFGASMVRCWFASDTKELEDLVSKRDNAAMKLEGAETKLIKTATQNKLKAEKKASKGGNSAAAMGDTEAGGAAARWLGPKDRPTHKLGKFGLYGKKVDSIEWSRSELKRLIPEIDAKQAAARRHENKLTSSVFVEFTSLPEAQAAYQSLTHHQALQMAPRFTGMIPDEIIWSNLNISWLSRVIRHFATLAIVVALIIFWSIPVAFVGAISNVNYLTCIIPAFGFINKIPATVLGVVTGLLPSVLLAVLMAVLPMFLRYMAKVSGDPTRSAVELSVQNYYFGFQVVQVFLVATLGSAASSSVQTIINNPASVTTLLATQIPLASNFYLSYFVLQGLGVVAGLLVGIVGLLIFILLGKLLDNTPRKMYKRWITLSGVGWGTLFPIYETLWIIAICYSVIAPLVLIFAAIGLSLFYFAYRYNMMFVTNAAIDTKGLVYPRALGHMFIGLYIAEVCLVGYFAIQSGTSVGSVGPLILMILMLIFTVLYHMSFTKALGPLLAYLPKTLDAEERLLLEEDGLDRHGNAIDEKEPRVAGTTNGISHGAPPHKKPNMFTKWLRPDIYTDYATMRRFIPKDIEVRYEPEVERDAFYDPAISSPTPLLWIPRDHLGLSRIETAETSRILPITDEGASLDDKGKIIWDAEGGRPPVYEEKVYY